MSHRAEDDQGTRRTTGEAGRGREKSGGREREKEEEDLGYPSIHKPGRDSRAGTRERRTEPTGWHIIQTHPIGVLSS